MLAARPMKMLFPNLRAWIEERKLISCQWINT
jgi:hypothetical protein